MRPRGRVHPPRTPLSITSHSRSIGLQLLTYLEKSQNASINCFLARSDPVVWSATGSNKRDNSPQVPTRLSRRFQLRCPAGRRSAGHRALPVPINVARHSQAVWRARPESAGLRADARRFRPRSVSPHGLRIEMTVMKT
jgi:hypothetical protein